MGKRFNTGETEEELRKNMSYKVMRQDVNRRINKYILMLYSDIKYTLFLLLLIIVYSCHNQESYHFSGDEIANSKIDMQDHFISVAHRGYHPQRIAENSALSYLYAKEVGFDYGETDIQWTKDDIPVCCHDDYFLDNYTKEKVNINDHTLTELKEYFYHYGTKISTLEEVINTCKKNGLGLFIDRFDYFEGKQKETIYSLIDYFGKENVCYLFRSFNQKGIEQVLEFDPYATIVLLHFGKLNNEAIDFANKIKTDSNKVIINVTHQSNTTTRLIDNWPLLKKGIKYGVWTINDIETYKRYYPYVECITSDSIIH